MKSCLKIYFFQEKKFSSKRRLIEVYFFIFKILIFFNYFHKRINNENIPQLRFSEFNETWTNTKLNEVSEVKGGKRIPKGYSLIEKENNHPYITVSDMKDGSVSLDNIKYVPLDVVDQISKYTITNKDIFISVAGTLGIIGIIPPELNGANLTENADKITNIQINQKFLFHLLNTNILDKVIHRTKTDNAQPKLALKEVRNIVFNYPKNNTEQEKIADFLSTIDKKIELMEMKLKTVKSFQNETLKNIFDKQDKDSTNWKKVSLNDLGIFYRGLSYNKDEVVEKGNVVLRSNNIKDINLNFSPNELQYVSKEIKPELLLQNKDIVICMNNGSKKLVGKSAEYNENINLPITVGAFCSIFRPNNKLTKFLFRTGTYKRNIYYIIAGSNINNLKNSEIGDFKFYIPTDINEENKIFELLTNLDKKTYFLEKEIEKNKQFKKSLLSKMFC